MMRSKKHSTVGTISAFVVAVFMLQTWATCHAAALGGTLRFSLGQQKVMDVSVPLEQVAIGDPDVVDVKIISQGRQILVTAIGKGTTDLITWDVEGKQTTTMVHVILKDIRLVQREVKGMLGNMEGVTVRLIGERVVVDGEVFTNSDMQRIKKVADIYPEEVTLLVRLSPSVTRLLASEISRSLRKNGYKDVSASGIGDKIFLEGTVRDKSDKKEILKLAGAYFEPCVSLVRLVGRVEDLVLLDIRFMEVGKNLAEKIGVNWDNSARFEMTSVDFRSVKTTTKSTKKLLEDIGDVGVTNQNSKTYGGEGLLGFGATVEFTETSSFARTLAHPKLVCKSGEEAKFIAGGEIPIVLILTDRFAVQYKDYGIILKMSPVVHSDRRISATVEAESSALDWANQVEDYPALRVRSVETYVTMEEGKVLALSGLVKSTDAKDVEKVPVIGNFPILGELFKSRNFTNDDTELVIFLSASLMDAGGEESGSIIRPVKERYDKGDKILKPHLYD